LRGSASLQRQHLARRRRCAPFDLHASAQGNQATPAIARRAVLLGSSVCLALSTAKPPVAHAKGNPIDPKVLEKAEEVNTAIKNLAQGPGNVQPVPLDDLVVGVIDDGSPTMMAAMIGVASTGARAVKLKGSLEEMQTAYRDGGCVAAVALDSDAVKQTTKGIGLSCENCGSDGGESPPRWFLVMEGKGKTNKQLQEDGGVTGRVESLTQPGTFVEVRRGGGIFTTGMQVCSRGRLPCRRRVEAMMMMGRRRIRKDSCRIGISGEDEGRRIE